MTKDQLDFCLSPMDTGVYVGRATEVRAYITQLETRLAEMQQIATKLGQKVEEQRDTIDLFREDRILINFFQRMIDVRSMDSAYRNMEHVVGFEKNLDLRRITQTDAFKEWRKGNG